MIRGLLFCAALARRRGQSLVIHTRKETANSRSQSIKFDPQGLDER